jgi:myo-inositol-1(or 4)-monophosphatase
VLAAPALGDTYAACAGGGATLNGAPIRAASTTDLRQAIVEIGWNRHRPDAEFFSLLSRAHAGGATLRLGGSGALGLAETASGRIDAYAELHIQLWDCAAAIVICREAGAFVSPFMDGDGPVHGGSILAAAPGIAGVLGKIAGF